MIKSHYSMVAVSSSPRLWICGDLNYRLIAAELELDRITNWRVSPSGWPSPRVNLPHSSIRISTLIEDRRESAPLAHQPQGWVVTSCRTELSRALTDTACMIMTWIKNEWKESSVLAGFIPQTISCWPGIFWNKVKLTPLFQPKCGLRPLLLHILDPPLTPFLTGEFRSANCRHSTRTHFMPCESQRLIDTVSTLNNGAPYVDRPRTFYNLLRLRLTIIIINAQLESKYEKDSFLYVRDIEWINILWRYVGAWVKFENVH